jgi:hypothetical protein
MTGRRSGEGRRSPMNVASHDDVTGLCQFSEPIVISPDLYQRCSWLFLAIFFSACSAALFFVERKLFWFMLIPVTPFSVYYYVLAVPGSTRIHITPASLTVRYLFLEQRHEWESIRTFVVDRGRRQGEPVAVLIVRFASIGDINRLTALWHLFTPAPEFGRIPDVYSLSPEELAKFLNSLKTGSKEMSNDVGGDQR